MDKVPRWHGVITPREWKLIQHAHAYTDNFADAGAPGHNQFVLISKLALELDEQDKQIDQLKLALDQTRNAGVSDS